MENLSIYTDGAYSSNRNQGGWSFIVIDSNNIVIYKEFLGHKETTNNRMEITAVLNALKYLRRKGYPPATIYTDSMYVIGTLTLGWEKNKNLDLWEQFDSFDLTNVHFVHVKGHADCEYNNMCDTLAVLGSKADIKNG